MNQLFVYGTLRKGGASHHLLKGAQILKTDYRLQGFGLYSAGWYPIAVPEAGAYIMGDVVLITQDLWPRLDAYEGEEYQRHYLQEETFWLYIYPAAPAGLPKISSGDWLAWIQQPGRH